MSAETLPQDMRSCHIRLDSFEGPLDLLLYLIRRDELDICDVPVAHVAGQYLLYIRAERELNLNIASEYLVMAATLTSIKSRSLLPSHQREGEEAADPGAELRRQLIIYRAFREIARELQRSEETWRDIYTSHGERDRWSSDGGDMEPGQASLLDLLRALESLTVQEEDSPVHSVAHREMTITECIETLEKAILPGGIVTFSSVLGIQPTRKLIVSYFVTILELVRRGWIALSQPFPFAEITLERTVRWTLDS